MSDTFKSKVISELNSEIGKLTGGQFEQFGHSLLRMIEDEDFEGRGTTITGSPRGYTVDATASGADYVYEASTVADYFASGLAKLKSDLAHAIKMHPGCTKIWLLSALEKTPTAGTDVANEVSEFKKQHPTVTNVNVWGSREIASQIFDNLASDQLVESIRLYLPSLERLSDEYALTHLLPVNEGYLTRPQDEASIADAVRSTPVVTLAGISGSGKSALAAAVARTLKSEFDVVVWYDASRLTNVSELTAAAVGRRGMTHNLAGLMKRRKTLLILDDTTRDFGNSLQPFTASGSRVLATTQATNDPNAIRLPDLSESASRELLERDALAAVPERVFSLVWQAVGGYPLLLAALNKVAIQNGGWSEVVECCKDVVEATEDEQHGKVCQRILVRHSGALSDELAFVRWVDTPRFDSELARASVSTLAVANLKKRDFLTVAQAGYVRVHDVVFKAIKHVVHVDLQKATTFTQRLSEFIEISSELEDGVLDRLGRRHGELFARLLAAQASAPLVYAVGLSRRADVDVNLLGDPCAMANAIAESQRGAARQIEIRAIIEAIEARYTIRASRGDRDAAKLALETDIDAFDQLLNSSAVPGEMQREVRHHRAKMLIRLDRETEAHTEFEEIVAEAPGFAAGRLQLSRVLLKLKRSQDAAQEAWRIVEQARSDPTHVSMSVLLEALRVIVDVEGGTLDRRFACQDDIEAALRRASMTDMAIAFRLVASIASKMSYNAPEIVEKLFELVDWMEYLPTTDGERFDWGQAHKAFAKAIGSADARYSKSLVAADEAFSGIDRPTGYQATQHAETLILLERFGEARARLEQVPTADHGEFWQQRMSQALYGEGRYDEALAAIDVAIQLTNNGSKYLPAFLRDRAIAKRARGDADALMVLERVRDLLPAGSQFRLQVEQEVNGWRGD